MKSISDNHNKEVIIICELSVNENRTINTREWSNSYAKLISETEENTISWRFLISEDEKKVTLYERYKDQHAFKNHLSRILAEGGDLKEEFRKFSNIYTFEGIIYLGEVSDELISYIKDHGLELDFRSSIGGYTRY
ncbi:MAG: hypothetical protein CBE50_002475 [Flammeovirgaceae bacterium TMED290]|nr:MAG: hypothetical protein CBE50_002475 [Flammeovirgaceae bacterium TMED290]